MWPDSETLPPRLLQHPEESQDPKFREIKKALLQTELLFQPESHEQFQSRTDVLMGRGFLVSVWVRAWNVWSHEPGLFRKW